MIGSDIEKDKMHLEVISSSSDEKPRLLEVNPTVWRHEFSPHLLSLYNRYSSFNKRRNTSKTKTKAEVSGGGRKPWRQKGTGRARQGSIRSPQWRGGGVVFGPTGNENYNIELNKKVRRQALSSLLSRKLLEGEILLVDKLPILDYKTRDALLFLRNFQLENKKTLLVLSYPEEMTECIRKSFENLVSVSITTSSQVNISKLLSSHFVVFTERAFCEMEKKLV